MTDGLCHCDGLIQIYILGSVQDIHAFRHRPLEGFASALCSKDEVDTARERANRVLGHAEYSPNYQRLLEYGDATDVGDILAAGDESAIVGRLRAFRDAGVTVLAVRVLALGPDRAARVGSRKRTEAFVASLCPEL